MRPLLYGAATALAALAILFLAPRDGSRDSSKDEAERMEESVRDLDAALEVPPTEPAGDPALYAALLWTQTGIESLEAAIEKYRRTFGRLPPQRLADAASLHPELADLAFEGDAANECIETLLVVLRLTGCLPPIDQELDARIVRHNCDGDRFQRAPAPGSGLEAEEFVDAWVRPLAYLSSDRYADGPVTLRLRDGARVQVAPVRRAGAGFYNPDFYQLLSLGPNGKQDRLGAAEFDDVSNLELPGD
ncbi:MAG: hypothetical protein ACT4PV_05050 [Planctomycetaceae bacterium]